MSTVDTVHTDYAVYLPDWKKIEHITRLKMLDSYLIELNPHDKSDANKQRNRHYRQRAIFYAIAAQTVQGMLGTMFRRSPHVAVPAGLDYVHTNIDGANTSIVQQAQGLCDDVVRKSRAGLYVSFPPTDGAVSQQDMMEGRFVATVQRFEPEQIINWRTETIGSQTRLKLVVIREYREKTDRYTVDEYMVLRELYLDEDGVYQERHWSDKEGSLKVVSQHTPTDADGNVWREIPFIFVGAENNDSEVDAPVMLPLVELNIGHYRNSADWEDSVWYVGQAQPFMTGVSEMHLEMLREKGMYAGSRELLAVPDGGTFGYASPDPNSLVRQAMVDKVEMMLQLGARLMQPGSAAKTATEVAGIREAQHSVLSLVAANASEAYRQALHWAARYMGVDDTDDIDFAINQEFVAPDASPQEIQQLMAGFMQGTIPASDYIRFMQRAGYFDASRDMDEYQELIDQNGGFGA